MMRFYAIPAAIALIAAVIFTGCSAPQQDRETEYQVSTIGALMQGVYDGSVTAGSLPTYGDIGVGTFQALDGEMVVLDGVVYQVKLDGTAVRAPDAVKVPFAAVTFFDVDRTAEIAESLDLPGLQSYIDQMLPTQNVFYAVKIDGKFKYMKTRSVPAQQKPYPILTEAVKNQQVSEFNDVEGTVVGFRCPPYVDGVNVPGYHFHFLTRDRTRGGHVLDLKTAGIRIDLDSTSNFVMVLPDNAEFNRANLGVNQQQGLQQVEKGK
jgi:acetolactate decarboxylase